MKKLQKYPDFEELMEESIDFNFHMGQVQDCKPNNNTGWRILSFFVIINVQGGDFYCYINKDKRINVSKGQTLLIPPGLKHLMGMDKKGGVLRWAHVHASVLGTVEISSLYDFPLVIKSSQSKKIGEAIEAVHNLNKKKSSDDIHLSVDKTISRFQLLKALLQTGKKSQDFSKFLFKAQRLTPVLKYIQNNLDKNIERGDLASLISLSEPQFHTVFKGIIGIAPMEYVKMAKLEKAQQYLSAEKYSIKEIAILLGYYDGFHFSKQFKKAFGISPKMFKLEVNKFLPSSQVHI